jgi:hypothetical protein
LFHLQDRNAIWKCKVLVLEECELNKYFHSKVEVFYEGDLIWDAMLNQVMYEEGAFLAQRTGSLET